jgi:hypothetical protein
MNIIVSIYFCSLIFFFSQAQALTHDESHSTDTSVNQVIQKQFFQVNAPVTHQPKSEGRFQAPSKPAEKPADAKPKDHSKDKFHDKDQDHHWDHDFNKDHHLRDSPIQKVIVFPVGFSSVVVRDGTFYYNHGQFYQLDNDALVPVEAPLGAVVGDLPTDRTSTNVDGTIYEVYNNVYYVMTPEGRFQVVEPPSSDLGDITTITDNSDSIIVHIPNSDGNGYSTVILTRTEDGFVGPQEEFYSEFPTSAQLKAMYGK